MTNFQLATDQFAAGRQDRAMQMEQIGAQALGGAIGNAPQQFMDARDQQIQAQAFVVEQRQQAQMRELQMIAAVDERTAFKHQLEAQSIQNEAARLQLEVARQQAAGQRATREEFAFFLRPENRIIRDEEGKIVGMQQFRDGAFRPSRGEDAVRAAERIESQGFGLSPAQRETNRRFNIRNELNVLKPKIDALLERKSRRPSTFTEEMQEELDALQKRQSELVSGAAGTIPRQDDPLGDTTQPPPRQLSGEQKMMVEEINRLSDHPSMQAGGTIHQLNAIFGDAEAPAYSPRNALFWEVYGGMLDGFQEHHGRLRGQSIVAAYLSAPGPWMDLFLNALGYPTDSLDSIYTQLFGENWRDIHSEQEKRFGHPGTEPGRSSFEVK